MSVLKVVRKILGSKEDELRRALEVERDLIEAERQRRRAGMREMQAKLREAEIAITRMTHPPVDASGMSQAQYRDKLRRDAIELESTMVRSLAPNAFAAGLTTGQQKAIGYDAAPETPPVVVSASGVVR